MELRNSRELPRRYGKYSIDKEQSKFWPKVNFIMSGNCCLLLYIALFLSFLLIMLIVHIFGFLQNPEYKDIIIIEDNIIIKIIFMLIITDSI
jgi:hypothetical protein